MAKETYRINGRVIDRQTRAGVAGLRVEAWDKDLIFDDLVGGDTTDAQGAFHISFDASYFAEIFLDRRPDLYFKVFRDDTLIASTEDEALWNVGAGEKQIVLEVGMKRKAVAEEGDALKVSGTILLADGSPASGINVSAFDKDLRSEQALGEGPHKTNSKGYFEVLYYSRQFRKQEKGGADIVVKAFAADGSLLAASPILFNAPPHATVDLTIPAGKMQPLALFEKIKAALDPLLDNLKVEELEEDQQHQDLTFLAGETGFDKPVLARFVIAHKPVLQSIQAEFWFALLGGSFFQYDENNDLADQLATLLSGLPSLDTTAVQKLLTRSLNQNEIPESLRGKIPGWIEAFLKFAAAQAVSAAGEPTFVKSALEDAGITAPAKQEVFAGLFNEHKAITPELLEALQKDKSFNGEEIADISASFQLRDIVQCDFSVIKMLKEAFDVRQPEQIRKIAKQREADFVRLAQAKHSAGEIKIPFEMSDVAAEAKVPVAEIFGKNLCRQFRDTFPTTAFAGGLERALQNGGSRGVRHAEALSVFLNQHEHFELLNTSVDDFFGENVKSDFRNTVKNEDFKLELKAVQRVSKFVFKSDSQPFEAVDALLADNLHSAQQVYRMGKSEFVRQYTGKAGFTAESAQLAWNRAADTHAGVLTIIGDLNEFDEGILPGILNSPHPDLANFPNWNNLFKSGDMCECKQCCSVLSPSAYFADLLMFLKDRKAKNPAQTVKDILFARRPDLGYLELNCDNAMTTLPYIDVVCEVLEAAVDKAGENDLELQGLTAIPDNSVATTAAIAQAFKDALAPAVNNDKEKIEPGIEFSLSQVNPPSADCWVLHGDNATYLLKKKSPSPNFFAKILRNTKTNTGELRAYPQYVNPKTYKKLREAKYPHALPFDLFAEEVRAGFQKTNLQRWDLMRTLRGNVAPNNPADGEIAAEYFGISADPGAASDEKRLILNADITDAGQQSVWGEAGGAWLATVGNVKNFLRKTGLEYNDLLVLLDLKFINPSGDIVIRHLDTSCDTEQKAIEILDAPKLDRIHRFLRLWRKLENWKMWELDHVIAYIGAGKIEEAFLINLFYFDQLKNRLGAKASVEQVCALFGNINTKTRFTKLHEKREDALYQNLFQNKRLTNPLDQDFKLAATGDLSSGKTISTHSSTILAALGIGEPDLNVLRGLTTASDGSPYINDDLNLDNLSFLWRQAWLSKLLKFKAEEWKIVLKLFHQDLLKFSNPRLAWEFIERIDHLKNSGFTADELNWLLAADRSAKTAPEEAETARFLTSLRKELQGVKAEYDPAQYAFLMAPTDEEALGDLLTILLQKLNRSETEAAIFQKTLQGNMSSSVNMPGLAPGFAFPATITGAPHNIPIQYDEPNKLLRFTGLMTATQKATLLDASLLGTLTTTPAYMNAINELFRLPRLGVKFFEPVFAASLKQLSPAVDFKTQLPSDLAGKIAYDAEKRLLHFSGIMLNEEKTALDALSTDLDYLSAIQTLHAQPETIAAPDKRVWLSEADLDSTTPANDTYAKRLANAANKTLNYLTEKFSANSIVQQSSIQLGLSEDLARYLLTSYQIAIPPSPPNTTLMSYFKDTFALSGNVVEYATQKNMFDSWYWAVRVAAILKRWKITREEIDKIKGVISAAQLLDFGAMPLDAGGAIASLEHFLRTSRLIKLRETLPETKITLLEVLNRLSGAGYAAADFASDVEKLNEAWPSKDVKMLVDSLNLAYPADYLLVENWDRLHRAFYFLDNLNAGAETVKAFAAAAMSATHAQTLKKLLHSKLGAETWLTLCAEIQDVLRERKRDALAAYLLTQPMPVDAPSGKWENTNDLYAYYLLDVEMSSCQLTSRMVQGSGSIQLFVQRCFMGLEPNVLVNADGDHGDSAWRWWKWMRKFQVWVANRKVFLWPENWIEPELKKDRSPFFKDIENELMQNEINQDTVETAFSNYLEKLDGVAQLEIAGFYQEDVGDNAIIHVFGRTAGAEPHLYYYRRYDYRRWTPWEKVDLDIQGDYLIPAVVNKRLFLFWPIFTEVPDDTGNKTVKLPTATDQASGSFTPDQTKKKLRMQMAVSDFRQGKWTPKKVSKDFDESGTYRGEISKNNYVFFPVDRSEIDGRFGIQYSGNSLGSDDSPCASLWGAFEISGCKGIPEKTGFLGHFTPAIQPEFASVGNNTKFLRWEEESSNVENDFTLENRMLAGNGSSLANTPVLNQTPGIFRMSPPWHLSYFDKLFLDGLELYKNYSFGIELPIVTGSWLPFFYNDKKRTFFVLPSLLGGRTKGQDGETAVVRYYYPEIKKTTRQLEDMFAGFVQTNIDSLDLSTLTMDQRKGWEDFLYQQFPGDALPLKATPPSFTDKQLKNLMQRFFMRYFHAFLGGLSLQFFQFRQFHFKNFYHPFVCDFARLVYNPLKGIPALMSRETQLKNTGFDFDQMYQPTLCVVDPVLKDSYPKEVVDFSPDGSYSPYNWELFFHAPLLIANSLSKNQRFEEAREWYHFIFNPLGVESAVSGGSQKSKYWITKPFFEATDPQYVQQRIDNILKMLAGDTSVPGYSAQAKKDLEDQVSDWRTNPFEPHRIANYRTVAYQKTVVMKYLDNLIEWGDNLFRQDSMEGINEATQLYILAAEILGRRPKSIPPRAKPALESFNELENNFDKFSNALLQVENYVPLQSGTGTAGKDSAPLPMLYFCIPLNDKMLGYWDKVADRLYKIRHCMNIEGVVRQLALFEPPIDPTALVKAVAGGVDIGSALADLGAPLPLYRFNVLLQKANEVCNDVKALGGALLAALEKKDGEAMGLLRQGQEIKMLEAVKAVKEKQIEEAKENLEGTKRSKATVEERRNYYRDIDRVNSNEKLSLDKLKSSHDYQTAAQAVKLTASIISLLPDIDLGASGFGGTPLAKFKIGGLNIGQATNAASDILSFLGMLASNESARSSIIGGHDRRWDDWKLQERLANKELLQLDKQIASAELRIAIAQKELENHLTQIENAKAINEFMTSKYTNKELYQWQVGQISGVYFQSYRLAYDLAKRAEKCFRFELGLQDSSYINFGYWDSLKKGLLSGEKLQYDLRRLETAYQEKNRREFELSKHVSLAMLDPLALVKLRETGRCFVNLPEEVFDLDYPGHYFRRIKSVSITLPCVVGPYATISCTLRLLKNSIRVTTANGDNGYPRNTDDQGLPVDDDRFIENTIPVKAIAASNAQNDSGVFELSFRDERYLPFEGAGVVSQWSLELFSDPAKPDFGKPLRQFDYSTISDAILHVKYTAREDAGTFKNGAIGNLREYYAQDGTTPSLRMFNLKQDFPTQWHRFLNPANPTDKNVLEMEMSPSLFPFKDHDKTIKINSIVVLACGANGTNYEVILTPPLPAPPPSPTPDPNKMTLVQSNQYGGLHFAAKSKLDTPPLPDITIDLSASSVKWRLTMTRSGGNVLQKDPVKKTYEVKDIFLVMGYEWV